MNPFRIRGFPYIMQGCILLSVGMDAVLHGYLAWKAAIKKRMPHTIAP